MAISKEEAENKLELTPSEAYIYERAQRIIDRELPGKKYFANSDFDQGAAYGSSQVYINMRVKEALKRAYEATGMGWSVTYDQDGFTLS
jgi:hypothetical protein